MASITANPSSLSLPGLDGNAGRWPHHHVASHSRANRDSVSVVPRSGWTSTNDNQAHLLIMPDDGGSAIPRNAARLVAGSAIPASAHLTDFDPYLDGLSAFSIRAIRRLD